MAAANSGSVGRGKVFVPVVRDRVKNLQVLKRIFPIMIKVSRPSTSFVNEVDVRTVHAAQ